MRRDDRELSFEQALARHLRSDCPDAEILAAYQESALPVDEMNHWKAHFAQCASCREILASLAISEGAELDKSSEKGLETAAQPARVPWPPEKLKTAAKKMPRPTGPWRWAAPLGAVAAGILVFAVIKVARWPGSVRRPPTQIAENRAPVAAPALQTEANLQEEAKTKGTGTESSAANVNEPRLSEEKAQHNREMTADHLARTPILARPAERGAESERALDGAQDDAAITRMRGATQASANELKKQVLAAPANAPAPQAEQPQMAMAQNHKETERQASAVTSKAAPEEGAPSEVRSLSGAVSQGAEVEAPEAGKNISKREAIARAADVASLLMIASPDQNSLWRVGENGAIFFSANQGIDWQPQSSGVTSRLSAGVAPSKKVCWIVGERGTILRTLDAGEHWTKITSPTTADWAGVHATDALHATIWDAAHILQYQTSDGGESWKALVSK